MIKALASKKIIDKDIKTKEFYSYIKDILDNRSVEKMSEFKHHYGTTCLQHCINVAYYNYILAKFFNLDKKSLTRAGLLHDMYLYDRKSHVKEKGEKPHGYRHPAVALYNAASNFSLNDIEKEIILKHMWPLTISLPKYKETYIITLVDKYCCLAEISCHFANLTKRTFMRSLTAVMSIF